MSAPRPRGLFAAALVVACAGIAALPAGGAAASQANPGVMWLAHDDPPATLGLYARPTGMVVLDMDQVNEIAPRIDELRAAGGEFFPYVNLMEAPIGGRSDWEERGRLYGGDRRDYGGQADVPEGWWWRGSNGQRRTEWPRTWMLDITSRSRYANHAVRWAAGFVRRCRCDGLYLDVLGARLWGPTWERMSRDERRSWSKGAYDLIRRLRRRIDPDGDGRPMLIANNTQSREDSAWAGWPTAGNPALNGFTFERHPTSQAAYYDEQVTRGRWLSPRRMMVIPRTYPADCSFWDQRDTVDAVLCTSGTATGYGQISVPLTPFRPRID